MTEEDSTERDDEQDGQPTSGTTDTDELQSLTHRVEEIEAELESADTRLRSIQDAQEGVSDDLDEMQQTVRRLLSVYERVTDDVNPFTKGESESTDFQFGLLGDSEPATATDGGEPTEDQSVGIEDLREASSDGGREDTDRSDSGGTSADDEETTSGESESRADETQSTEADPADDEALIRDWSMRNERGEDPTPVALADTYATDIIAFEWLSELIQSASPAAAIRAISYYREIGWISDGTEAYLLDVLSGPDLDAGIDPNEPAALDAVDHAESYAYIRKLAAVREMTGHDP